MNAQGNRPTMKAQTVSGFEALGVLTALALVVAWIAVAPLALLWSIATIAGHPIPWTFARWIAAAFLVATVRWGFKPKKK